MKFRGRKVDIGITWAKYVNTWGQVGAVAGTANLIMMLGVFYTTTLRPAIAVPLWLYILVVVVVTITMVLFVLKIGISGYYRFFSKQSEVAETNRRVQENDRKLGMIIKHLGIDDARKETVDPDALRAKTYKRDVKTPPKPRPTSLTAIRRAVKKAPPKRARKEQS